MSIRRRRIVDRVFRWQAWICLGSLLVFSLLLGAVLLWKAWPMILHARSAGVCGTVWRPAQGRFGLLPFLAASGLVTLLAMLLAGPVCILAAAHLSEYSGRRLREALRPAIEILAGVPSVVFGLFGAMVLVPALARLSRLLGGDATGFSVLAGGLVLAIMVLPFVLSLSLDVFLAIPQEARETALALGATRWETLRKVLLRAAAPGLVAAQVLGMARAFGETMAVVMVVGNVARLPHGLLDPACPIPALLANLFGEMMSVPRFESALMLAALALLLVVGGFSLAARVALRCLRETV